MFTQLVKDIKNHRDLILHLTLSDFKSNTSRTYLGFLWWILDPILYMGIFYLLVQVILQRGGPDYSVYLFTGLIPLKWVTACLVDSTNAISSNARIIQQVYVPKVVFIIVRLLVNTFKFLISSVVLFLFLMIYGVDFSLNVLYFPIIVIANGLFLVAIMMFLAHIGVFIRDVKNLMQYVARTLLYLSPVLFKMETVPDSIVNYLYINPLTTFLVSYRNVLLYGEPPNWTILSVVVLFSIIILYLGLKLLMKNEKEYAKVI